MVKKFFRQVISYFLQGLVFFGPIAVTLYLMYVVFVFLDNWNPTKIPGVGVIGTFLGITLIGLLGNSILFIPVQRRFKKFLKRATFFNTIYTSIQDFFAAFVGKDKKFKYPVLVTINKEAQVQKLGFITQHDLTAIGQAGKVLVYCPHSYNFSGEIFIVPAENVTPIHVPSAQMMKFIVSGGVSSLEQIKEREEQEEQERLLLEQSKK